MIVYTSGELMQQMEDNVCPLTGVSLQERIHRDPMGGDSFFYSSSATGKVQYSGIAGAQIPSLSDEERFAIAGIYRNLDIMKLPIEAITSPLIQKARLKDLNIVYDFEKRARHFLKYLYDNGGKEYKQHNLTSTNDSPITYSTPDEFNRIIKFMLSENWIECDEIIPTFSGTFFQGLNITKAGIKEIETEVPKNTMTGLLDQTIFTGVKKNDAIIEHAKELFRSENATFESKRSACESLAFVLESIKYETNPGFSLDTKIFFGIVNDFAIRHNKATTKHIEHEEQLEWTFYGLLNTLNTHMKMKNKFLS